MGTTYSYLVHDEFDWAYVGYSKAEALSALKDAGGTILGQWYAYIAVDFEKRPPRTVSGPYCAALPIPCDTLYEAQDNGAFVPVSNEACRRT